MTCFRVSFYKHLLSSDGHPFRCLQQSVKIGRARSIERAVLAAKHRFERRRGLPAWDLHADDIDVEISETGHRGAFDRIDFIGSEMHKVVEDSFSDVLAKLPPPKPPAQSGMRQRAGRER